MRSIIFIILSLVILGVAGKEVQERAVYQPFTSQEIAEAVKDYQMPIDTESAKIKSSQKGAKKERKIKQIEQRGSEDDLGAEQFTPEQIRQRKKARKLYNKLFKYGLYIGCAVLALILIKFYKERRSRQVRGIPSEYPAKVDNQLNLAQSSYVNQINKSLDFHEKELQKLLTLQKMQSQMQRTQQRKQYEYQNFKMRFEMQQSIIHRNNHIY